MYTKFKMIDFRNKTEKSQYCNVYYKYMKSLKISRVQSEVVNLRSMDIE